MRIFLVIATIARLLRLFSLAFVPPLLLAMRDGEWPLAWHFLAGLLASFFTDTIVLRACPLAPLFHRGESLGIVSGTWLATACFGAIPYMLSGLSVEDAVFESMSGFTTTGATVLTDFSSYGRAFFLWRAMTHWFGGLGVIALFVVVLPKLGIAGRQLFFAEASEASEPISPQIHQNARKLWSLYASLTALQSVLLFLSGMPIYDSVVHSLATLAAGGFSPHPQSVAGYQNPTAEWIFVVFMILGGTSFTLLWKGITSNPSVIWKDGEFRFYIGSAAAGAVLLAFCVGGGQISWELLRAGAFQSASVISSTGFASVDFNQWNDGAKAILVVIMLVSGCAGSAAGGPKAIRILIVLKLLVSELGHVLHPYGVAPLRYGRRVIPFAVLRSVVTLVALYALGYVLTGVAVVLTGTDLVTGFSASLACFGNIGPGFGLAGPMGNYAFLPWTGKVILTVAMWVGRLEVVAVLALFHPDVWRNSCWRLQAKGGVLQDRPS